MSSSRLSPATTNRCVHDAALGSTCVSEYIQHFLSCTLCWPCAYATCQAWVRCLSRPNICITDAHFSTLLVTLHFQFFLLCSVTDARRCSSVLVVQVLEHAETVKKLSDQETRVTRLQQEQAAHETAVELAHRGKVP